MAFPLVSLSQQWLFAYQDQRLVFRSAVTTGMPELPTLTGTFHIRWHEQNITFYVGPLRGTGKGGSIQAGAHLAKFRNASA
jgi:L,D-transpeptidase-like protein